MLSNWINHASDWNPQLARELKGRFKARNVLMAIAVSVILQLVLIAVFYAMLPSDHGPQDYCLLSPNHLCLKDAQGNYLVNWQLWWTDITRCLHWLLMYGLMVPGVFFLVLDLAHETQRGTLNFIRLSPQSAWTILSGKLLGIPSLLYVGVLAVVPFYSVAAIGAKLPFWMGLSFYTLLLGGCGFLYSAALLTGFLSKFPGRATGIHFGPIYALIAAGFVAIAFVPLYMTWNALVTWYPFQGYFLSNGFAEETLIYNRGIAHAFIWINLAISTYWLWQALYRCFHQPTATIISKKQSYGLTLYLELLMVGFLVYLNHSYQVNELFSVIVIVSVLNVGIFLVLMMLLSIHRQGLLDWARYRHLATRAVQSGTSMLPHKRISLLWDLVWGERSPAIVAIALNLLIFSVPLLLLIGFGLDSWERQINALAGVVITVNFIILCAVILQLALLMKTARQGMGAILILGTFILTPFMGAILSTTSNHLILANFLFLFSPIPWVVFQTSTASMTLIGTAILGQWLAIVMVNVQLTRQLKKLGQSASKLLLSGSEG